MCRFLLPILAFHVTHVKYNWYGAPDFDISNYNVCTREEFSGIKVSLEGLQCEDVLCNKHRRDIDVFYSAITNCQIVGGHKTCPSSTRRKISSIVICGIVNNVICFQYLCEFKRDLLYFYL